MLQDKISEYYEDPFGFVCFVFAWGEGDLKDHPEGPDGWQREQLEEIGRQVLADPIGYTIRFSTATGHGVGKAGNIMQLIPTPDGVRKFGDLQPGDYVFGVDGKPTRVTRTIPQGVRPMYRVTFDDGSYLDTSAEHEWNVKGRAQRRWGPDNPKSKWITMETQELLAKGVKRKNGKAMARDFEIPVQGAVHFNPKPLPINPYVIGAWLGDGGQNGVIGKPYDEFKDLICSLEPCKLRKDIRPEDRLDMWLIKPEGMLKAIKELGLKGCISDKKFIPDVVKYNSVEVRHQCLQGLMDSDGYIDDRGICSYTTTSKQLADDFVYLARSLGAKARMQPSVKKAFYKNDAGERVYCKDAYNVTITAPLSLKLFNVKHKAERRKEVEARYVSRWIESIERIDDADQMCITVEAEDGLYQAGEEFIVTHNSTLTAWVIHWFLATRYPVRGVTTANTLRQLMDKTWAELNLWHSRSVIRHWFRWTATKYERIGAPGSSFVSAAPNSEHNSEAFQGLHGEHVLIIMDEASGIPIKIWDVCQGAMTGTRAIMLAYGNPTLNTGRFFEIHNTDLKKRWTTWKIDSRTAKMTNKVEIEKWIEDEGIDSDFIRVRVRGMFPRQASAQFIGGDIIEAAKDREIPDNQHTGAIRVMGVDVARYGDDQNVIAMIEGRKLFPLRKLRNMDGWAVAEWISMAINDYEPDMVCIDGVGVGGPVVDFVRRMGHEIIEVNAGAAVSSKHKNRLSNKRIEMYWELKEWLKTADIPNDKELLDDLRSVTYTHDEKRMVMKLVSKEDMKKIGLPSPDCFVAGTLVATPSGNKKIETIETGVEVLTPHGKSVVLCRIDSVATDLITVEFSNGKIIQCKPDHAIFTWNRGLIKAKSLSIGDTIETLNNRNRVLWRLTSLLNTRARGFTFKQAAGILHRGGKMTRNDFYTEEYGVTLTGLYQRIATFVTRMRTGETTSLITSNVLMDQNTKECISSKSSKTQNIGQTMRQSSENQESLLTMTKHIDPQRVGLECLKLQKNHGLTSQNTLNLVRFVGWTMRHIIRGDQNFVARFVRGKLIPEIIGKSVIVRCVRGSLRYTSTMISAPVVTAVRENSVGETAVYDLTLQDDNVYYANGVLVENCSDAVAHCFFAKYPQTQRAQSYEPGPEEF